MNDTLIIIISLLLFIVLWIMLAWLHKAPLKTSTHFSFAITLITLIGFGLWTMTSLNSGGFSGLVIYGWMVYGVPVAVVTYLLAVSFFTLARSVQLWRLKESKEVIARGVPPSRAKTLGSLVFVVLILISGLGYFYVEYLESQLRKQQLTETDIRDYYHNPMVRLLPDLRASLGRHHSTPLDILAKLFDDSNKNVWWTACMNNKATHELLLQASKSSWPNHKECVLANSNAPVELLRAWAGNDNERIRRYIARHKNTPPDILLILSRDNSLSVQGSVAINQAAPGEALTWLATSDNPLLRGNVARHTNTPVSVLEQLAKDSDPKVRLAVLLKPPKPLHIIEMMLNDTDKEVRAMAKRRLIDNDR